MLAVVKRKNSLREITRLRLDELFIAFKGLIMKSHSGQYGNNKHNEGTNERASCHYELPLDTFFSSLFCR
jgi:hypothetical protein